MSAELKKKTARSATWTWAFGLSLVSISLILALGSYHADDPSFSSFSSTWKAPQNVLGYVGSWVSDALLQVFGYGAWFLPSLILIALFRWLAAPARSNKTILGMRWWLAAGILLAAYGLSADLVKIRPTHDSFPIQGILGIAIGSAARPFLGKVGSYLCVASLLWAFCMVWWEELPAHFVALCTSVASWITPLFARVRLPGIKSIQNWFTGSDTTEVESNSADNTESKTIKIREDLKRQLAEANRESTSVNSETSTKTDAENLIQETSSQPVIRQSTADAETKTPAREKLKKQAPAAEPRNISWDLPPLSLLEQPKRKAKGPSQEQLLETAKKITSALKSFEIEGEVVEISPGPIITMYEFQPAPGVRAQKIMAASTDLAMTLGASSVRIVAPIPGKSVAGIEVPNPDKEDIVLRDCYELTRERATTQRLPLVLGKDAEGKAVCEDLSRMPHLLVGGATSMGKSVLVNSILTGLLCRFTPEDLRLIIVDPKLVEFKVFEDIPHLLLPIVNDAADASQALKWAVTETKRRYLLMQKVSAKNLEAYNQKIAQLKHDDNETSEVVHEKFPYIVIIIDELAELMFTAKKDVEQSIVRLTQLARAAGIHLIMATQRPSADVVTGLIKSNCPSRAALRVSSGSDSRIILDCTGAEQLLGRGDMFFTNTGPMGLRRMQSAFVSDGEIEKICDFWCAQGEPEYKEEILAPEPSENETKTNPDDVDSLYGDVLEFAKEKGKISTSLIQRKFQIGYSRAARIMEQLEQNGVVGDQQSAGKPRDVIL